MRDDLTSHLLISSAGCDASGWLSAIQTLQLPCLGQLLQGMALEVSNSGDAESLSPPHERALASAIGLAGPDTPDGLIPWAAADAAKLAQSSKGQAWAWITPCHWAMASRHASLTDPSALQLQPAESQTLLTLMQPYFDTDGIHLHLRPGNNPTEPVRWLAEGELFRDLPTASLDRVVGRNVDAWLPQAGASATAGSQTAARTLRRLQNEMQMLLYSDGFNDARSAAHQLPVNSFWASGTGALAAGTGAALDATQIIVPRNLLQAVLQNDWAGYAQAWQALDAGEIATLLDSQRRGKPVRLTLCGDRNARTYVSTRSGAWRKVTSFFRPFRTLGLLEQL